VSATRRQWTLPLRRWLALALLLVVVVPVAVTIVVAYSLVHLPQISRFEASNQIRNDVAEWHDPAWQERTRAKYAPHGVDFVLIEDGQEIYRSSPDPQGGGHAGRVVQQYTVDGDPSRQFLIYADLNPSGDRRFFLIPLIGLSLVLTTIGGIAWFIGRTVVRPLAATSAAARQVAAGDLAVDLPASRVREVNEVNTAFEGMSTALGDSLHRQSDLEQQRRMFIGAVVHDLRTPLFTLRGSLEGIRTGVAGTPEKREEYLAVAEEKADALERLIGDLFDYTRLEYLEQAPNRERLDLAELLGRLAEQMQPQAAAKGIALTNDISHEVCHIDGDPHLLTRAIENLLDNALRFTSAGGAVNVTCRRDATSVTFAVADNGPGIPPEQLPHLFEPLYRGEGSRNRRTGGAGLGLSIAQRIIDAHGGTLTAANRPDGGALFTATLPRSEV